MPVPHVALHRRLADAAPGGAGFGLLRRLGVLARGRVLHAALIGGMGWVAAWFFIALPWGFGFPLLPTSERMAQGVGLLLWPFCVLLIWLGASTLPLQGRSDHAGGMVRRMVALWLAAGALVIAAFGAAAMLQWIDGRVAPDLSVHAAVGVESIWVLGLGAAVSVAMPVLLGRKWLGAGAAAAMLFLAWLASRGAWPGHLAFSEMVGYTPMPFGARGLHWSALAVLLALLAWLVEGRAGTVGERLAAARLRFKPNVRKAFALAAMLWLASGAWLLLQADASGAVGALAEGAKRDAGRPGGAPQPQPLAIALQAAVFPGEGRVEVAGAVLFGNLGVTPLSEFDLFVPPNLRLDALEVDARPLRPAAEGGSRRHAFHPPLRPIERVKLTFAGTWRGDGRGVASGQSRVLENGTVLVADAIMPTVGAMPASWGTGRSGACAQTGNAASAATRVRLAITVSTSLDQRAVAPGALRREWKENDRRYFEFETRAPVPLDFSIHSARYAVAEAAWKGVQVEVFHHPGHAIHAKAMLAASLIALRRNEGAFGAYPFAAFRVVEVPHGGCAAAAGGVARRAEGLAFSTDLGNPRGVKRLFAAIEGDVAGQWSQPSEP